MDRSPAAWVFSDAPYAGGAERYLEFLLRAAGPDRMGLVVVDSPGLAEFAGNFERGGFRVDRIAATSWPRKGIAFLAWVRRTRPALVHVNLPGPNDGLFAVAPLLARLGGVDRVVVTEHLPSVGRIGRRGLLKRITSGAIHRAIAVCEAHVQILIREFGYTERQVVAIANGIVDPGPVDSRRRPLPEDLAATAPPGIRRVVQVGALDERKGGVRLLEAFAEAAPDASLWFVGEGPDRSRLERLAVELGLGDRVRFTGRRADLPMLLRSFDLVVLASEREGMPYVLLEALAMARPILASRVDGIPELVREGENGVLVGPEDPIGLARELGELCSEPDRLRRMGAAGRARFAPAFTLERCLAATWRQYGEVARGWPTHIASS
jgi:glycosyltransferase involved in cell wall biosynthesis